MSFKNAKIRDVGANPVDYFKQPGKRGTLEFQMSSSSLRAFWSGPSKWVEPIVAQDGTVTYWEFAGSKSTKWGNLFDTMLLTPEQFDSRYAVRPDKYKTTVNKCPGCGSVSDAKSCRACKCDREQTEVEKDWSGNATECSEWSEQQEAAGKEIATQSDLFKVKQAIERFNRDGDLKRFVDQSQKQVWIEAEWHDPKTGMVIPCKCLIDLVPTNDSEFHKCLGDVKTTKNARVIPWEQWCHRAGYDVQAAWNTDMFVAASNREILNFCFLLSENEAPWQPGRRMMSQDVIDPQMDQGDIASGRRQYRKMMADYCQCLKTGKWPGFDDHDESASGWTIVRPDPYMENKRMYAPKFQFGEEEEESAPEEKSEHDYFLAP